MPEELDPNAIAVALIKDIGQALLQSTTSAISNHLARYSAAFSKDFQKYYTYSFANYSHIKTLLNREKPVSIESQYVAARFKYGNKVFLERELIAFSGANPKISIVGTAGSGKSVFLKHYFLQLLKSPKGRLPILLELRHLDLSQDQPIEHWVLETLVPIIAYLTPEIIRELLRLNKIVLLFDGYDEIDFDNRKVFENRLMQLCQQHTNLHLVLTTRPEETLYTWDMMNIFEILPLTKEDALSLIKKFDYPDEGIKEKFARNVDRTLYLSHKSFIGNPLLLSMLLLTYEQVAEIPDKLHIFYEQAFEALYQKHDAMKRQYKRRMYSSLPIDEFRRLLSTLSYLTYSNSEASFTKAKILEYIQTALKYENIGQSGEKVLNDLMESICLLQKDGLYVVYNHKSFQDYFCAAFIARSVYIDVVKTIEQLGLRAISDNIVPMLVSMHPEKIERFYVLPTLRRMIHNIDELDSDRFYSEYISAFAAGVRADREFRYYALYISQSVPLSVARYIMLTLYPSHFTQVEKIRRGHGSKAAFIRDMKYLRSKESGLYALMATHYLSLSKGAFRDEWEPALRRLRLKAEIDAEVESLRALLAEMERRHAEKGLIVT